MFLLKKTSFLFTLTTYLILLLLPLSSGAQSFDKKPYNRFQFHKYKWEVLHTKAFSIYFPIGYDSLCAFTARELPGAMELVKRRMGASLRKEPNVIIYPSVDQLYESNIGGFEIKDFTLPTIVHKGTRVMLPFSGSYTGLKEKLQEALVRVVWEEQFKNDLDAQLKGTAVGEKIPAWFSEGAISYFANGWSIEDEDALRRTFIAREYQNWQEVAAYNGRIAGAALCHYLSQQYYRQAVMQLFFQLRKKRSLPSAMRLIAKRPLDSVLADCLVFYRQRFYGSVGHSDTIQTTSVFPLIRGRLKSVLASPGGSQYAYIVATFKERSVWVYDQQSGKQTKVMSYKLPPWISNNTADPYPIVEWHSNGKDLLIAAPGKGKITIKRYTTSGGNMIQENTLYGVDGVNTMQSVGLNDLLLSAYRKGQSDVVKYDARRERYAAYTGYIHDDRDGVTGSDGWLYFISDRTLKRENYSDKDSLYSANGIFRAKDGVIEPVVVDTLDFIKWNRLTGLGDGRMLATHTRFGMERFALINGNGTVTTLAPYEPFFLDRVKNTISFYRTENGSVRIQEHELQQWITSNAVTASDTSSPWLADYRSNAAERAKEDSILKAARSSEPSFLDGVLKPKNAKERSRQMKDSTYASLQYDPKKIRPYVLQLHSAYFTARVNNDYFINRYQP